MRGQANIGHKRKESISWRFIVTILIIMISLVGTISTITYFLLVNTYEKQIKKETSMVSAFMSQYVSSFIDGAYSLVTQLAVDSRMLTMEEEIQAPILVDCADRNEYLELLYVQGTDGMQTARSTGDLGDRSTRWWFLQVMEEEQAFVSKSYYSVGTKMPCTSIFVPMYKEEELIGVFAADIKLDYIQQMVENFSDHDGGRYSFIIDGEGVVMAHPDSTYLEELVNYKEMTRTVSQKDDEGNAILEDGEVVTEEESFTVTEEYQAVFDQVMAGNTGTVKVKIDGVTYYASYTPITLSGVSDSWSVITLQESNTAMRVVYQVILIIVFITAVIGIAAVWLIHKSLKRITQPIILMSKAARQLATGDLQVQIDYASEDEIGILAESLRTFIQSLRKVIRDIDDVLMEMAQGNMTAEPRIRYPGEFSSIQNSIGNISVSLSNTLQQIDETSKQVSFDSKSMEASSKELSSGVSRQTETIGRLSDNFITLSNNLRGTADTVNQASTLTAESHQKVEGGRLITNEMNDAMEEIRQSSVEITKIIKSIEQIASRTNMLSLNASIEAARAGEAGRGFAIVAEQVRELATQSAEAARTTSMLIETTLQAVENGAGVAGRMAQTLTTIVENTEEISVSVESISTEILGQAESLADLTGSLDEITNAVQTTSEVSQQSASASMQLSEQAQKLKSLTGQFHLKN